MHRCYRETQIWNGDTINIPDNAICVEITQPDRRTHNPAYITWLEEVKE